MVSARNLCLALLPVVTSVVAQANTSNTYQFTRQYSGSSFFDRWQFYDNFDNLTNGDVTYVSQQVASSAQLAYLNDAGNIILKVDNTTKLSNGQKRNSIRIQTADAYGVGNLWIADMTHVPFGCSVWPAWWSGAPNWPQSGEIDTFEGVNQVTMHQTGLHTLPGCQLDQNATSFTGLVNSTNCAFDVDANSGCTITNPSVHSYGQPFADAGGGVWVTELAKEGISIWFFTRSVVPQSLLNITGNVDTSTLGRPVASYPAVGCNPENFFDPQHLTLNIDLCGDYAGNIDTFAETCSGTCYNDYVIGPPSYYNNAYFEIKSIRTYHNPSFPPDPTASIAPPTPSSQSTSTVIPHDATIPSNGAMRDLVLRSLASVVVVGVMAGAVMAL